jgi:prepilin-type N-terminal cleavage/methylation domain-containing protein
MVAWGNKTTQTKSNQNKMTKFLKNTRGFTLTEVILVMVIIVIVSTVIITRSSNLSTGLISQTDIMKTHLRYAQTLAISAGGSDVFGIRCSATPNEYWLFRGIDPNSNILKLTDDASYDINGDDKLELAQKDIQASAFTVFFDGRGIPYSAYTDASSNTPLSPDLTITVTPSGGGSVQTITITELTGFIP